jgi:hypothetical protein
LAVVKPAAAQGWVLATASGGWGKKNDMPSALRLNRKYFIFHEMNLI